jgi:hypothetical protein
VRGPKLIANAANADSPDFSSPEHQVVTNTVGVARSARVIAKVLDVISGPGAPKCVAAAFGTAISEGLKSSSADTLPAGTKIGTVSVSPESFAALGDRTVAFQASIPVSIKGSSGTVYVDIIIVQQGRAGLILTAEDTLTPFPVDVSASLLRKVLARLPHSPAAQ